MPLGYGGLAGGCALLYRPLLYGTSIKSVWLEGARPRTTKMYVVLVPEGAVGGT